MKPTFEELVTLSMAMIPKPEEIGTPEYRNKYFISFALHRWAQELKPKEPTDLNREFIKDMSKLLSDKLPDNWGFLLLAAPFGEDPKEKHRLVYTSNIERENALNLLKEFLFKNNVKEDWMKHIK